MTLFTSPVNFEKPSRAYSLIESAEEGPEYPQIEEIDSVAREIIEKTREYVKILPDNPWSLAAKMGISLDNAQQKQLGEALKRIREQDDLILQLNKLKTTLGTITFEKNSAKLPDSARQLLMQLKESGIDLEYDPSNEKISKEQKGAIDALINAHINRCERKVHEITTADLDLKIGAFRTIFEILGEIVKAYREHLRELKNH